MDFYMKITLFANIPIICIKGRNDRHVTNRILTNLFFKFALA